MTLPYNPATTITSSAPATESSGVSSLNSTAEPIHSSNTESPTISEETVFHPAIPKIKTYPSNPNAWHPGKPCQYPVPGRGVHWNTCHRLMQNYDKNLCGMWTDEVDKLLVFAGLFSATVTPFIIESYGWLGADPTDTTNLLLSQIYNELRNNGSIGGEQPSLPSVSRISQSSAERINICWFLSLTLSLTTVLIGILCMQWVREYRRDIVLPQADLISLRQMRFNGLTKWKVSEILSSLPLLLQIALILFFVGVIDLLWTLNHPVAIPVTIVIGLLFIFMLTTTMLPTLQIFWAARWPRAPQCAYKSPQSWIFYRLFLVIVQCPNPISRFARGFVSPFKTFQLFFSCRNWNHYDSAWQKFMGRELGRDPQDTQRESNGEDPLSNGLIWITQNFKESVDAIQAVHHCLQDVSLSTAAHIVSALDPRVDERLCSISKAQSRTSSSGEIRSVQPHSELRRDLIMAYFHEIHRPIHSASAIHQLEYIVRLIGNSEHWRLRPYIEWPVQDIRAYPEDMLYKFLHLIAGLRNSNTFTRAEILGIWKVIHDLSRNLSERDHASGTAKVQLMSILIRQLNQWLISSSFHISLNRSERIRICTQGLIDLFFPWPSMMMDRLQDFSREITVVYTMMASVNGLLRDVAFAGVDGTVLDSSHRDGWLSLNRQLDQSWDEYEARDPE